MTEPVEIEMIETATDRLAAHEGRVALVVAPGGKLPTGLPRATREVVARALESKAGKAMKPGATMELAWPAGMAAEALHLVMLPANAEALVARKAGAAIGASLGKAHVLVVAGGLKAVEELMLGIALRAYDFSIYHTRKDDEADATAEDPDLIPQRTVRGGGAGDARLSDADAVVEEPAPEAEKDADPEAARVTVMVKDPAAVEGAADRARALAEAVFFTRDLVNEPANVLTTVEFADRLKAMESLGLKVEVLEEDELERLGMRALLAVGMGSETPSKVVVMRWDGGQDGEAPLALVGKGVVFDTGGISIKPSAGMEEMTMDMGGAGVVSGVMRALATRNAKANVVGLVGLVENMPDGRAQRPGDIVKSMKGDMIEVINTDAEGRLVLADVLWYAQETFKPKAIVDLATLTGAVIIALGHENAGVFANDDALAGAILDAAKAEGEGAWRLPLAPAYDRLIKSRLADVKNSGGRPAGSITAAQFLQRFIRKGQPWAHIDIAGVALPPGGTDLAPRGATGWGVLTLDRMVRDGYEDA
ncbi:leucyl aminopeptidase [Paracoccus sp. TK19116]|uniref:Probable cytosol aminopeptidase n=1 Tax=Paracoccus albicereus TaxID=2922394 RepID=A0ABT1MQF3_9RHOB|nr:leucyl aminopeptidase [Paracoccus albicereus]MCQ0970523.1 leucyl aminopeptidase [Paracoccus albicereus]